MAFDTVVVAYPTHARAVSAIRAVHALGVPMTDIRRHPADPENLQAEAAREHEGGIWNWLFGRQVPLTENKAFEQAVDSGGVIVSVNVIEEEAGRVMKVLQSFSPLVIGKT